MLEYLNIVFPVAGIEMYFFIPPVVAFTISFFTSMAGISGAFLLLPFQVSVLGFATPSVTATNFLYNVVGTPGGVIRFIREKRLVWPLAGSIIAGTIPGLIFGYWIRATYLPDPRAFKMFVGIVLLFVGWRLFVDCNKKPGIRQPMERDRFETCMVSYSLKTISFTFRNERICFSVPAVILPAVGVGIVSGIYGIGGGAIIAPFLVTFLRIPVYAVAGAVLLGNFLTSFAGMVFYTTIPFFAGGTAPPDWLLGGMFGVGGLAGMYWGAKWQHRVPERAIKAILGIVVFTVSVKYIIQYF